MPPKRSTRICFGDRRRPERVFLSNSFSDQVHHQRPNADVRCVSAPEAREREHAPYRFFAASVFESDVLPQRSQHQATDERLMHQEEALLVELPHLKRQ